MKKIYEHNQAIWTDLLKPTEAELKEVSEKLGIDPDIAEDLSSPTARHNVTFRETHAYLVLHFPAFKDSSSDAAFELDFVVGKDFLLTVHYSEIAALDEFARSLGEVSSRISENGRNALFFGLLQALIGDFDQKLVKVDHWVRDLEKNMFAGKEKRTIFELSEASRHLIDFKKITAVYPEALKELEGKGSDRFGAEFSTLAKLANESFMHIHNKLEMLADAVKELRETNASILSTKQNETMKTMTAVMVLATIIVGIALVWVGLLSI